MTAVNLKTLLTKANRNNYSVAGLVVISWEPRTSLGLRGRYATAIVVTPLVREKQLPLRILFSAGSLAILDTQFAKPKHII